MLYLNDANHQFKTYDEVVAIAIANGVQPKRVYIYLAALGVRGGNARVLSSDKVEYLEPVKMAIKDKKLVKQVTVCKSCKGLVVR